MPMANPLLQGLRGPQSSGGYGGSYDTQAESRRQPDDQAATPAVGTGDLTASHNLPLHVGMLILLGLALVFGLNLLGFRFVTTVGAGRGG